MPSRPSAHDRFSAWASTFDTLAVPAALLDMSTAYVSLLMNKLRTPERYDARMKIEEVVGIPAADWDAAPIAKTRKRKRRAA